MSEERCPNCLAEHPIGDKPCRKCGWIPLQATEMQFIDSQSVVCPHCAKDRPVSLDDCPHCGNHGVLESLSERTSSFRISSLLLLTTLIAICFALLRAVPWLGVVVSLVAILATLRTILLVRHRERHRYPVSPHDLLRMFAGSLVGVLVAMLVFGGVSVLIQLPVGLMFGALAWEHHFVGIILVVILILVSQCGAVDGMVVRHRDRRKMFLVGIAVAWAASLFVAITVVSSASSQLTAPLILGLLVGLVLATLALGCRTDGAAHAKSFVIGCSTGICTLGVTAFLPETGSLGEGFGIASCLSAVLLWPTLLSIIMLEKIWSWDDAFPHVASRVYTPSYSPTQTTETAIVIPNEEGIAFTDNESDGTVEKNPT